MRSSFPPRGVRRALVVLTLPPVLAFGACVGDIGTRPVAPGGDPSGGGDPLLAPAPGGPPAPGGAFVPGGSGAPPAGAPAGTGGPPAPGTPAPGAPSPSPPGAPSPSPPGAAPACRAAGVIPAMPLRRLTRREYDNTVADLLGVSGAPAAGWLVESKDSGFDSDGSALSTGAVHVRQFQATAEQVAQAALAAPARFLPCDPRAVGEARCGELFVQRFGRRAYRRPLQAEESARLGRLFEAGRAAGGFEEGVRLVLEAVLQAPQFLYRLEVGGTGGAGDVALTDHEVASRLSYLLWGSMPDEALFAAADAGKLRTPAEVRAQAERMLAQPRARETLAHFYGQWLRLERLKLARKDPRVYPGFDEALGGALADGLTRLGVYVTLDSSRGDLAELLAEPSGFVSAATAPLFGVRPPGAAGVHRTPLDARQRAGLLTDPALMTALAKFDATDPVHRGKFVREQLLCQSLPMPPDNVPELGALPTNLTTREWFGRHREDPSCAGCHALLDPIGLGLENYDAVGRYRDRENGRAIDATGALTGTRASDGPFDGAVSLARRLAGSAEARECMTLQWFRFTFGRREANEDECLLADVGARFAASGHQLRALLLALVESPAFLRRPAGAAASTGGCGS